MVISEANRCLFPGVGTVLALTFNKNNEHVVVARRNHIPSKDYILKKPLVI